MVATVEAFRVRRAEGMVLRFTVETEEGIHAGVSDVWAREILENAGHTIADAKSMVANAAAGV